MESESEEECRWCTSHLPVTLKYVTPDGQRVVDGSPWKMLPLLWHGVSSYLQRWWRLQGSVGLENLLTRQWVLLRWWRRPKRCKVGHAFKGPDEIAVVWFSQRISIISSLSAFKWACDLNGVFEDAAQCSLQLLKSAWLTLHLAPASNWNLLRKRRRNVQSLPIVKQLINYSKEIQRWPNRGDRSLPDPHCSIVKSIAYRLRRSSLEQGTKMQKSIWTIHTQRKFYWGIIGIHQLLYALLLKFQKHRSPQFGPTYIQHTTALPNLQIALRNTKKLSGDNKRTETRSGSDGWRVPKQMVSSWILHNRSGCPARTCHLQDHTLTPCW